MIPFSARLVPLQLYIVVLAKKICVIGAPGVGKTSLIRRFVFNSFQTSSIFTPVEVGIEKRRVVVGEAEILLALWDFAGGEELQRLQTSYLRGTAGYILVVDGTNPETLTTAIRWQSQVAATVGPAVPFVLVLNKADQVDDWRIGPLKLDPLSTAGWSLFRTSAKDGEGVESVFNQLASVCAIRRAS